MRCRDLAIGYPEREIAGDIDLEIDHGSRAAIVGDNGQGKTTFLRTLVDSLKPLAGEVRWGYGCQVGVYAQHVYTSLPDTADGAGLSRTQRRLRHEDAGHSRPGGGPAVPRRPRRRSRSRSSPAASGPGLCLAGLLLANTTCWCSTSRATIWTSTRSRRWPRPCSGYKGTVIFTSHDRHFMKRVATCIVEVRDGRVVNYRGEYDAYLYAVNKEIDDEERERESTRLAKPPAAAMKSAKGPKNGSAAPPQRNERAARKEMTNLERTIAQLDEQKRQTNDQLLQSTDAAEALRLHNEVTALTAKIAEAEDRWCQLQEELAATE